VQVQVPANLPASMAKPAPAAKAAPPPPPAQARPAPRPAQNVLSDEDKTPPPTRNPFARAAPADDDLSAPEEDSTHSGMPPRDEPKVEISEDLLAEAASARPASTPPRRPMPPPAGAPNRPTTGSSPAVRPGAVPPRRPVTGPGSSARPAGEDGEASSGSGNQEKTQIRSPPPDRPRR